MNAVTSSAESPVHAGEQALQEKLGVRERIEPWARQVVRPWLPDEHRQFYADQPFLVVAARDDRERPWATLLTGEPGFASSPRADRLRIEARPTAGDALEHAFADGADLGILGIELATRRRNRVNGRIEGSDGGAFDLQVGQAFGNCPQYITPRAWRRVPEAVPQEARRFTHFVDPLRAWIRNADTFFIATGHRGEGSSRAFGMDASHRGGEPGFVRVEGAKRLAFPDYAGNRHYNTLGNLELDPRAGLLFVDFATGSMLQLTGRAHVDHSEEARASHPGAERVVVFELDEALLRDGALPLRWEEDVDAQRSLRLVRRTRESADVSSFVFDAADGGPLPPFEAGQHLPIEIRTPGGETLRRTYSLSAGPEDEGYRISVKREAHGRVSGALHEGWREGDLLTARAPAGQFVLPEGEAPLVLASAGVGLTPLLSMLRHLVASGDSRPVLFAHVARDGNHHAHAEEVRALVASHAPARAHVTYTRSPEQPGPSAGFDAHGRLDAERLLTLEPHPDAEFLLCGPTGFMAELQGALEARGVSAARIHTESFGPSS